MEEKAEKSLPSVYYRSSTWFQKEKQAIFCKEWQLFGLECELPKVGSYLTKNMIGFPIFVVRTADGYRGYHNVCRHRGKLLVTTEYGDTSLDFLSCKYHGWSFNLQDGSCKSAPYFDQLPDFNKNEWGLYPIRVDSWEGAIFVNLDENAISLREWLGPIVDTVEKIEMRNFTDYDKILHPAKCNWKVFLEGYQECYHCSSIHANLREIYDLPKYTVKNFDTYSHHICPRKQSTDSVASHLMGGKENNPGIWLFKYPNLCISCYPRGNFLMSIEPTSPSTTEIHSWYRYPQGTTKEEKEEFSKYIVQNNLEDVEMCEQVQVNLNVGKFQFGPLHPTKENGVRFFQQLVKTSVANYKPEKATISIELEEQDPKPCHSRFPDF